MAHPHLLVQVTNKWCLSTLVTSNGSHQPKPSLKVAYVGRSHSLVAHINKGLIPLDFSGHGSYTIKVSLFLGLDPFTRA